MKKSITSILVLLFLLTVFNLPAFAAGETCLLELFAVPSGATIRVSFRWGGNDYDEAIEDEGYIMEVTQGGSGQKLSVWRQPATTVTLTPFRSTGSYVRLEGYKDPNSTTHSEGNEVEGCEINATINNKPPWAKDAARDALPLLGIGTAGLGVIGIVYPPARVAAYGVFFTTAVAKWYADDPIDCSTSVISRPIEFFRDPPFAEGDDAITHLSNRIARNGTRTLGIAKAAVINANRAACNDFSDAEKLALFTAAQNQSVRVGRHVARLAKQLNNLTNQLEQAGVVVDADNGVYLLQDWHFNFSASVAGYSVDDLQFDGDALKVMTVAELDDIKRGFMGIALIDFHNCNDGIDPCELYPQFWPDGLRKLIPLLERWSASLLAKETGL